MAVIESNTNPPRVVVVSDALVEAGFEFRVTATPGAADLVLQAIDPRGIHRMEKLPSSCQHDVDKAIARVVARAAREAKWPSSPPRSFAGAALDWEAYEPKKPRAGVRIQDDQFPMPKIGGIHDPRSYTGNGGL